MELRTLAIIKPDAVERGLVGKIIARIEESGLKIRAMKLVRLTKKEASGFYHVHQNKEFFDSLIEYMTSGPCVLLILEGEDAVNRWRKLIGATNPENAEEGTIRKDFAVSLTKNSVHGSDSPENAAFETAYFFNIFEVV